MIVATTNPLGRVQREDETWGFGFSPNIGLNNPFGKCRKAQERSFLFFFKLGCCTYATLKHGNVIRSSKIMSLWCCRCLAMAAEMPPDIGLCSPDPDSLSVTMQREKSLAGRIFFCVWAVDPQTLWVSDWGDPITSETHHILGSSLILKRWLDL